MISFGDFTVIARWPDQEFATLALDRLKAAKIRDAVNPLIINDPQNF